MSHTKGPWNIEYGMHDGTDLISIDSGLTPIAIITHVSYEDIANAQLIAAAPELLEALKDMVSDHECLSKATLDFAKAALAKAEGK